MQIREFGKRSGYRLPRANIGAMRLPRDLADAVGLVRYAIDSGMCYIDVSRGYGEAEWVLREALQDGYRGKAVLSTKWSPWNLKVRPGDDSSSDTERRRIDESMRRLGVDYLDFYQLWSINSRAEWEDATRPGGMLDGMLKARDEGLVRHLGFTTHDEAANIAGYIEEADWCESILFSYNLLDTRYGPAMEAAHRKGIGVQVMNPVGGGKLTEDSPVFMKTAEKVGAVSVPDLAIRYVLSNPNVDFILCGISKTSDVDDTIASVERPLFSSEQTVSIREFVKSVAPESVGFCTACKYCLPCPQGIQIPAIMDAIYWHRTLGLRKAARQKYKRIKGPGADACIGCGECEGKCTQHLRISEEMAFAARTFTDPE